jgi:hypothetical protein
MDCLLPIWHKEIFIPVRLLEDYSNEAHQSAIAAAIEFSKTLQETESQFDYDISESEDDYGCVMNPMKAKIASNYFLQALPECPPIHWPSQILNDPQLYFKKMCPSGGSIGQIQSRFGVGIRSFSWNRSVRNSGALGESSTYFREASRRLSTRQEWDWHAPDAC